MSPDSWKSLMNQARKIAYHRGERTRVVGGYTRLGWSYIVTCGTDCALCVGYRNGR